MHYLRVFSGLLQTVVDDVYHYEAHKQQAPFIVWTEYQQRNSYADDMAVNGYMHVMVEYFTLTEYDSAAEDLKTLFEDNFIPYDYRPFYDPDTNTIRHTYDCQIIVQKEDTD